MTRVLLPLRNEKDLEEIPAEVLEALDFKFADSVLDALAILFPGRSFAEAGAILAVPPAPSLPNGAPPARKPDAAAPPEIADIPGLPLSTDQPAN
jgi:hypothetical protein